MVLTAPPLDVVADLADRVVARAVATRTPVATYRLQFNREFTFRRAAARAAYLHALGVTDVYASPYLKARPESAHGYDVTDHRALNPGVGGEADYHRFTSAVQRLGMGQVLDVVPNHMGIGSANPWWMDVLENGPAGEHAGAFDIDWRPKEAGGASQVLLPILGDQYGRVLERGELAPVYVTDGGRLLPEGDAAPDLPSGVRPGSFLVRYWEHLLPLDPHSYPAILTPAAEDVASALGQRHDDALELQSIVTACTNLPERRETAPERVAERAREKEIIKRRLATLTAASAPVGEAVARALRRLAGVVGDPRSFDALDALLDRQAYRLSFWRVAAEEIDYRRFFDINDLAAIRVERPEVFCASHALILSLLARGAVNGLRIDHIDGLWDPAGYTHRLQAAYLVACFARDEGALDGRIDPMALVDAVAARLRPQLDAGGPTAGRPLWVVAEKILGAGEPLPAGWAVNGATGYEFANALNGLFVDASQRHAFDDIYVRFSGMATPFRDVVYTCKHLIMETSMASELNVLGRALARLAQRDRCTRDFTLNNLTDALREVVACFPVYRTYISGETERVSERDRGYIETAVTRARNRNPAMDGLVFDFVRDTLLLSEVEDESEEDRAARRDLVMKVQQYTGPVMAKGVEDTAFYRYNRLVSLNEVGGEPDQFGASVATFHRHNAKRRRDWPLAMISTATHDTKRGEDVRARINVISELPREWRSAVTRWSRAAKRWKRNVDGQPAPDRNEEYLFYQTLVGVWPADDLSGVAPPALVERLQAYMLKAAKEAKVNTSWINPNRPYDDAVQAFVADVLSSEPAGPFFREFLPFQRRVARAGMVNSLAQVTLKLASPGVPDTYQGTELWDLSLVDPDNRRPVDYRRRAALLAQIEEIADPDRGDAATGLLRAWPDGRIKLYLIHRALTLRRRCASLFLEGGYLPLDTEGARANHVCAFARRLGSQEVIAAGSRLTARLFREPDGLPTGDAVWAGGRLVIPGACAGDRYRDQYTGAELVAEPHDDGAALPLSMVFAALPVALLERL